MTRAEVQDAVDRANRVLTNGTTSGSARRAAKDIIALAGAYTAALKALSELANR
jgi:hypothetical protein